MRRVWALLLLSLAVYAHGESIYDVIPDDAVVVVVARSHRVGVDALGSFLEGCVPANVPPALQGSRTPLLSELSDLRRRLPELEEPEGARASEEGLVVLVGADSKPRLLTLQPVTENEKWRPAAANIKETRAGLEMVKGQEQSAFTFAGGYLVSARSADDITAYVRCASKPLSQARREALEGMLGNHTAAANVSGPALTRVWANTAMTPSRAISQAVWRYFEGYSSGTNTMPLPDAVLSAIVADYLAYGGEIYAGADFTETGIRIEGRAGVKKGSIYAYILAAQTGGAEEAIQLVPTGAAAGAGVSLDGEVFWEYAKGMVASYVSGVPGGQSTPGSLKLAQQIFDDYRLKVGFKQTAFALQCVEDGKYPAPMLIAKVADAKAGVSMMANAISALYGDPLLVNYGKQMGFYFKTPVLDQKNADNAAVAVPFSMSASDPMKAARVKDLVGTQVPWRICAVQKHGQELLVAGGFSSNGPVEAVMGSVEGAKPLLGDLARGGGKTIGAAFINLPVMVAARAKVGAKASGKSTGGIYGSPSIPACAVTFFVTEDGLGFEGMIPQEQIKAAFGVAGKSAPAPVTAPADTGEQPKPPSTGRRSHRGFGRDD